MLKLHMDDLSPEQQQVAGTIGLEAYSKLIEVFGGTFVYVPKPDAFLRITRNEQIQNEYNGANIKTLALKYDLSEVQIRNILADEIVRLRGKPIDGQCDFFTA